MMCENEDQTLEGLKDVEQQLLELDTKSLSIL